MMNLEMRAFELPQYYETTVAMRLPNGNIEREFLFLSLPAAAVHEASKHLLADPPALLEMLGLDESTPLRVAQLPDAILALLADDGTRPVADASQDHMPEQGWLDEQRTVNPEAALLAEYLTFAEVVPFEQSRAQAAALATKAMKSYAVGGWIAGSAGVATAFGPHIAVAYTAGAAGVFLAVSVVNSIGVAIGFVSSEKTADAVSRVRRGFRRLIRGNDESATADESAATIDKHQLQAADEELLAAERARLDAQREYLEAERKLREVEEAHRRTAARQAAMRNIARQRGKSQLSRSLQVEQAPAVVEPTSTFWVFRHAVLSAQNSEIGA